jgi:hypothetical protein
MNVFWDATLGMVTDNPKNREVIISKQKFLP